MKRIIPLYSININHPTDWITLLACISGRIHSQLMSKASMLEWLRLTPPPPLNHSNIEAVLIKRQPGDSPRTTKPKPTCQVFEVGAYNYGI